MDEQLAEAESLKAQLSNALRERDDARIALLQVHEHLERVEKIRRRGGSFIGLDHAAGSYEHCVACTVLRGETLPDEARA